MSRVGDALRSHLSLRRADAATLLRAGVLGISACVLWWPLTLRSGALLAGAAAFLAALAADATERRSAPGPRLRTSSAAGIALLVALLGWSASRLLVRFSGVAALLGPVATVRLSEAVLCTTLTASFVFALRLAAARRPLLALGEVGIVAAAFVASLAAHREGMVHRPLIFGDFAWSRGLDPTVVFLCLGGLCLLLLAALLLAEERAKRIPLHFLALGLVAVLFAGFVRLSGLPQPSPPADLGLTGEAMQSRERRGSPEERERQESSELQELEFKDEYKSGGGKAPVAVVLLHDDYSPPSGVYYFRQSVFSQYNGRRLVQATRDGVDLDVVDRFPAGRLELPAPPESDQRRRLRTTTGLLLDHVRPFALDSPVAIEPRANQDNLRFQRTYEAESLVRSLPYEAMLGGASRTQDWGAEEWQHYTEAPADPRYKALADEVTSVLRDEYADDPLANALAVKRYLDESGIYSLKSRHSGADDPTASFLFGDLTGYCVHFAHAATYLLRSLGVPARVATGYAVPEEDRAGGSAIMIRGANAHAWPEVYLADVGWVSVDPTPERYLDDPVSRPDDALQSMLGEMLRRGTREKPPWDEGPPDPITLADVLRGAMWIALAASLAAFAVKSYRAAAPRFSPAAQQPRVAYRAALDRLAEVGLSRRFGESRERFAHRVARIAPGFEALTALHLRSAFGPAELADPLALRRLSAGIAGELRQGVPGWRRAVGILDPFAWLRSR